MTVAHAQRVGCILAAMHASGNGYGVTSWNKRQFSQEVGQRNNIDDRVWGWKVKELGSNLSSASPPNLRFCWTVIEHSLDQRTLALYEATRISAYSHLKDEIDASVPANIDSWTEVRCTTTIVGWRRNEHDVILRQGHATRISRKHTMEHIHALAYTYIYIHTHGYTYKYIDIHLYTCIYIHIYTYTQYIHAYT